MGTALSTVNSIKGHARFAHQSEFQFCSW